MLYKKGGIFNQKKPKWLRKLDYFHHLYRSHYHHQHPPPRFHDGILAEVSYSESYNVDMDFKQRGVFQTTTLPMPCPVFQPGEREINEPNINVNVSFLLLLLLLS